MAGDGEGKLWLLGLSAATALLGLIVLGYLFDYPPSVAGHSFSEQERGSLSEWVGGVFAVVAVLAAGQQLRAARVQNGLAQKAMQVESDRQSEGRERDRVAARAAHISHALASIEHTITLAAELSSASVMLARIQHERPNSPGDMIEGAQVRARLSAEATRMRASSTLRTAMILALAQAMAGGATEATCLRFMEQVDAVFETFGAGTFTAERMEELNSARRESIRAFTEIFQQFWTEMDPGAAHPRVSENVSRTERVATRAEE